VTHPHLAPVALTFFGAVRGLLFAALLFAVVCAVCVVILALLQAILPTGPGGGSTETPGSGPAADDAASAAPSDEGLTAREGDIEDTGAADTSSEAEREA